ncbi:MAG TPA: hypothetical protein VG267_05385 [Terracidiphilus sp.]|nr:hypothetical protein [Terracidiphilus sp.]
MTKLTNRTFGNPEELIHSPSTRNTLALPEVLGPQASQTLERMFRDPRLLEKPERGDLIAQLRSAVDMAPYVPEVRVLYGMALCVDLQAQEALEQMREAVKQAPDCFIAQLKFGELLMRLRICDQAAEHTDEAARLASNTVQSDIARRQATTIRTMRREGVERGVLSRVLPFRRKNKERNSVPALASTK